MACFVSTAYLLSQSLLHEDIFPSCAAALFHAQVHRRCRFPALSESVASSWHSMLQAPIATLISRSLSALIFSIPADQYWSDLEHGSLCHSSHLLPCEMAIHAFWVHQSLFRYPLRDGRPDSSEYHCRFLSLYSPFPTTSCFT